MRKALMGGLVAAVMAFSAGAAQAATWDIDNSHASVGFSVRHLTVSDAKGSFTKFKGQVMVDEKDITKSTVNVEIDATSVNTANEKRDEHLRSPDFFDTAKFPALVFKSTKVEKQGTGLLVTGDLTMHGVTKPVVLTVEGPAAAVKNPWGQTVSAVKATGKLNRKDFGLEWNKTLESGGLLVGEDVTLTIEAELTQVAPPAAAPAAAPAAKPAAPAKKK
jgi:polyisoprenoid-binding protein YceI